MGLRPKEPSSNLSSGLLKFKFVMNDEKQIYAWKGNVIRLKPFTSSKLSPAFTEKNEYYNYDRSEN